jgi:hypothetical protein
VHALSSGDVTFGLGGGCDGGGPSGPLTADDDNDSDALRA